MGDSVRFDVSENEWTDVSNGALIGFITNEGNTTILYAESNSLPSPSDNIGHTLDRNGFVNFELTAGQSVYARAVSGSTRLAVTPA